MLPSVQTLDAALLVALGWVLDQDPCGQRGEAVDVIGLRGEVSMLGDTTRSEKMMMRFEPGSTKTKLLQSRCSNRYAMAPVNRSNES